MNLNIDDIIDQIEPKCPFTAKRAKEHIETLTMPYWALGRLLDLAVDLTAMTRLLHFSVSNKAIFIMASDHGITEEGVSLYPKEVTLQMVKNFVQGGAGINVLSRLVGAETIVVDVGVDGDLSELIQAGHVRASKVQRGTGNFAKEPAMSRTQAYQALGIGIELALDQKNRIDLFGTGEMGIGNTSSAAAIASVITQCPVEVIVGRGTGIGDEMLTHKTQVIEKAIHLHHPDISDPIDILSKLGGFEIASIAGLILGAAFLKKPILVDGYISTAGALIAQKLCPLSMDYVVASHTSAENGHGRMWDYLGKKPLLDLGMRLGEGTGAALAMNLVEASARIMNEMATFESAHVSRKKS